ncbi:MAG: hypothetical protein ACOC8B_08445 [Gemmatimonadota bacterium]
MAYSEALKSISVEADADLSAKQYYAVQLSTDGQAAVQTSEGGFALGILQDDPENAGEAAEVGIAGVSKAHCNGASDAIAAGDALQVSTAGTLIKAAGAGDYVLARSMEAVSTGSTGIRSVLITHEGQLSS